MTQYPHASGPSALGVNIDHVATLRQARRARYPDPVHAALAASVLACFAVLAIAFLS